MKHLLMRITIKTDTTERFLFDTLLSACWKAGCHVCATAKHEFYPQGFSATVILAESHASIHSWPEKKFALVDYFSCAEEPHFELFEEEWQEKGCFMIHSQIIDRTDKER